MDDRNHAVLALRWVVEVPAEQAVLGALAFLDGLNHLDEPFDLAFRLRSL